MIVRLVVLFWSLLFVFANAQSLTRAEIRQRLGMYWGEFEPSNSYYPDSVRNIAINDAQWYIAHFGQVIERETTFTIDDGTTVYNLPADFDGVVGAWLVSKETKPVILNFMPWDLFSMAAVEATQFSIHNGKLYIFPVPDGSPGQVRIMFYGTPTDMSSDTSHCALPLYWPRAVPVIAVELLKFKDEIGEQDLFMRIEAKVKQLKRNYLSLPAGKPVSGQ